MGDGALSGYHASDGAAYERFLGRWTERLAMGCLFRGSAGRGRRARCRLWHGRPCGGDRAAPARRHVTGVDLSERYLEFARANREASNLAFQHADAAVLPFADASFSSTLAQLVLNFVPDRTLPPRRWRASRVLVGGLQRPCGTSAAGRLPAHILGYGRGHRSVSRCGPRPPLLPPARHPRRTAGALDIGGHLRRRDRLADHPHGLRRFRRLLGPAAGRAGTRRRLCEWPQPRDAPPTEGRCAGCLSSGRADGPRSLAALAWAVRGYSRGRR